MANPTIPQEELHPSIRDSILTPNEVRMFLADSISNNHLLDDVEFDDQRIYLAMKMAISEYNEIPPKTSVIARDFPGLSTLMYGVCYHLFNGQSALAARNQMSYSDGGLNIPIEERYGLYLQLAQSYQVMWRKAAEDTKAHQNLESGWGYLHSDYGSFPNW